MARARKGVNTSYEIEPVRVFFKVNGSAAGSAVIQQGKTHATLVRASAGVYTLTLTEPARRLLGVDVVPMTTGIRLEVDPTTDQTKIKILSFGYNNATPTDSDFFAEMVLSFSTYDR